jgi:hypothetical protein
MQIESNTWLVMIAQFISKQRIENAQLQKGFLADRAGSAHRAIRRLEARALDMR